MNRSRLVGICLSLAATGSASGAVLVAETFDGLTPGNVNGQGSAATGWGASTWVSSVTGNSAQVVAGSLTYNVTNTSAATVGTVGGASGNALEFTSATTATGLTSGSRTYGAPITPASNPEVWTRHLVQFAAGQVDTGDGLFIALNGSGNPSPLSGLFINLNDGTKTNDFTIRPGSGSGNDLASSGPNVTSVGSATYLVVMRLTGNGTSWTTAQAWVNPVLNASNELTATGMFSGTIPATTSLSGIAIRAVQLDAAGTPTPAADRVLLDEFLIGDAVGDAIPGATGAVVPEPATLGLAGIGAVGTLLRRRRR
ncbi:MAG: PEP-CTERM sorting domain-containing protein [Phycisphaerae bacterium]|nr:PEP-CTERM sorting domain-containing protein [Tepidisphaeraceae bacterium]